MSKKVSPRLFVADKNPEGLHFFAAANSKDGFVSFFDTIFGDKIERLYILIGGPGCGKSTALKKIAAKSEEKGFKTEYIHCSSSPESLDGVIISDKKIVVIDGTSPHTYTPKIPGAREMYVDLGAAWNKEKLYLRKSEIEELCRIKSSRYKRAYIYIAAANILKKQSEELVAEHILSEKLSKIAQRSYEKLSLASHKGEKNCEIRIQRAVSGVGNLYFDSFCNMAKKTVFVDDFYGTAFVFIEKLLF